MNKKICVTSRAVIIDQQQILLCKTLDLEVNFYFLPGGHINHGESATESLVRELKEETNYDCTIKNFLACLEYSFHPGHSSICHNHEYSFIFEAESKHLKSDKKISSPEKHIELIWKHIDNLQNIDLRAEPLKKLLPIWLEGNNGNKFISEMV